MVQEVQVMDYMPSMPESVAVPRQIEHEKPDSSIFFYDVILGILMLLFPVMLLVFLNGINIQEEYKMQRIRGEVMTMAKENAVDKLEVSRLEAPVRIQQIAEQKLKMSLPVRAVYGSADPAKPHPNKGR